jgi:1-acyl-sn-glycerol-3-phosphate acyltransferase
METETQIQRHTLETPLLPTREELGLISRTERFGFKLTNWMNQGLSKKLMTFCQRHIGSLWIKIATYNLMQIYGIENFEKTDSTRPILLVANHRSFFDLYVVSTALFRHTNRKFNLYFPVRAKFFYDSPFGWIVNLGMGWFSMFPPFFREDREAVKREFDKFSMKRLVQICSEHQPNIIGLHPEGKRNFSDNSYDMFPAQTGVGKIVMSSHVQVVPVFVAGLGNNLAKQVLGNWTGGEKIRVWFGEPTELSHFYEKRDSLRTHKEIADFLMSKIAELGEEDRKIFKP